VGTDDNGSATPVLSQLMAHPLISPYKHTSPRGEVRRNPSYLPAPVFAKAMIDLTVEPFHASGTHGLTMTRKGVGTGEGPFAQVLSALIKTADGSLDKLQTSLELWFDGQMDRVSGSYKRWAKRWVTGPLAAGHVKRQHAQPEAHRPASHSRGGGARGAILVRCTEPDRFTTECW
jgi:hypothetical protein